METSKDEENSIKITSCKFCKKEVLPTKIIMHIKRNKKCKEDYGEELQFLEEEQSKARKKYQENYQEKYQDEYKERNKEILRKKRAKKYQEQKSEVAKVQKPKMNVNKEKTFNDQAQKRAEDQNTKKKLDVDSSDEDVFEDEKIERYINRKNKEKLYKKKWYQKNSDKIKQKYDPKQRKEKHEKATEWKAKMHNKIVGANPDECGDEFYEDGNVEKFFDKISSEKASNRKRYEKNKEKIKQKYDPSLRKLKHQKEKEAESKMKTKIQTESFEELRKDKKYHAFCRRSENKKLYQQEWYKKNSEKIKKKQSENYDCSKRREQYKTQKKDKEENAKILQRKSAAESRASTNKSYEKDARDKKKAARVEATISNCESCKEIIKTNMTGTEEKVKEMEEQIEALYQKIELEIDGIVEKGSKLDSLACHHSLYRKLYLRCPPDAGSKY